MGAAVVTLLAAVLWGLQNDAGVRPEGGIATGGEFLPWGAEQPQSSGGGATPSPGQAGGAVPGVPPSLQPKPSPVVDAARARVAANPDDLSAHVQLGWALVDAEGWIDAYREAETILKSAPTSPDGRAISAAVRIVMGQEAIARTLIDEALAFDPSHLQALSYDGMLELRAGNREGAAKAWEAALAAGGDQASFTRLIALARSDAPLPPGLGGPRRDTPPNHPGPGTSRPPGAATSRAPAAAGGGNISGTLALGEGATPPPGGRIFVIARRKGIATGPPAASAALPPTLPATFTIGQANVMMGGPFPAEVDLTVRWDADGDAMTRGDDDLWGTPDSTLAAGTTGVEIILQ